MPRMPSTAERREPDQHDRPEDRADAGRPAALEEEQDDQDDDRDRDDVRLEERRRDFEPFDGAEHRDRRRDHAVAVEQRRAEDADGDQRAALTARCGSLSMPTRPISARMPPSPRLSKRMT